MTNNKSHKEEFYNWLSGHVSSKQLSKSFLAVEAINRHFQNGQLSGKSVLEISDENILRQLQTDITKGSSFRKRYFNIQPAAKFVLGQYITFVEETSTSQKETEEDPKKEADEQKTIETSKKTAMKFGDWLTKKTNAKDAEEVLKNLGMISSLLEKYEVINVPVTDIQSDTELQEIIKTVEDNNIVRIGIPQKLEGYVRSLKLYTEYRVQAATDKKNEGNRADKSNETEIELNEIIAGPKPIKKLPVTERAIELIRYTQQYKLEKDEFSTWLMHVGRRSSAVDIYIKSLEEGSKYAQLQGLIKKEILLLSQKELRENYRALYTNGQLTSIVGFRVVLGELCRYKGMSAADIGGLLKESQEKKDNHEIPDSPVDDYISTRLKEAGINFMDNRQKGGVLWVKPDPQATNVMNELRKMGAKFLYSGKRYQWWTKDSLNIPAAKEQSIEVKKVLDSQKKIEKRVGGIQNDAEKSNQTDGKDKALLEQETVENKKGNPDALVMEPALLSILKDEELAPLRDALTIKGVFTMKAFKELNLWAFMNENALYNIRKRADVYNKLKNQEENDAGYEKKYELKTILTTYVGATPAEAFLHYCEYVSQRAPLRFRSLVDYTSLSVQKPFLRRIMVNETDLMLKNPVAFIDSTIKAADALFYAKIVGTTCREHDVPYSIDELRPDINNGTKSLDSQDEEIIPKKAAETNKRNGQDSKNNQTARKEATDVRPSEQPCENKELQEKVDSLVLKADLEGMTLEQIAAKLTNATWISLKNASQSSSKLVNMQDRFVHVDAFVDLEDAAEKLHEIIEKLLNKNNGYASTAQLYDYARAEMQMFLNDNDIHDEKELYYIARHLFSKVRWSGYQYEFSGGLHISRSGKDALISNMDVFLKFAREANGFFAYEELVQYLEQVGIKTGNLRAQMQLGIKPIFFYYSSENLISAESMGLDDQWLRKSKKALDRLFADVGDHIVLRSINPIWYDQLPALPGYRPWTPLLLQSVLRFYMSELGARTIGSGLTQKYDVIHAMLVKEGSEIQTFADSVAAYIIDNGIEERQFEAEQLRQLLVEGGLITGGELIWNMSKALGSDPRFAWDVAGEKVTIMV